MARAIPYKAAVRWLVLNDDTEWVERDESPSVTACLVADIYSKTMEEITTDLRKDLARASI